MSYKRRKRAEAEFFVYTLGADVPRDVTHLLIPPGIEVLTTRVFMGLRHLREVVLSEGLQQIEQSALNHCTALNRITFPSTLVKIGDHALYYCTSLITLHFPMGLIEIGQCAFEHCSLLTHISLSSTVTAIGRWAFLDCSSLEVVIFVNGIRTIGECPFRRCALREIVLPATLIEIDYNAFRSCQSLNMVKLCGGIQLIKGGAFFECNLLEQFEITPKCLVITHTGESYNFNFVTDGTIAPTYLEHVVISSECFHSMSSAEVSALEINITEILEMQFEWGDKHERLRRLLAPHERRRKEEVASLLKFGVREAEMRSSGEMGQRIGEQSPLMCKMDVIVQNVVAFL